MPVGDRRFPIGRRGPVQRSRTRGVLTVVYGWNQDTGKWDGPFPLGFIPAKYHVIKWKYRGQWYQKAR